MDEWNSYYSIEYDSEPTAKAIPIHQQHDSYHTHTIGVHSTLRPCIHTLPICCLLGRLHPCT